MRILKLNFSRITGSTIGLNFIQAQRGGGWEWTETLLPGMGHWKLITINLIRYLSYTFEWMTEKKMIRWWVRTFFLYYYHRPHSVQFSCTIIIISIPRDRDRERERERWRNAFILFSSQQSPTSQQPLTVHSSTRSRHFLVVDRRRRRRRRRTIQHGNERKNEL